MANDKRRGGRVTPKKNAAPPPGARPGRRSIAPSKIGPFEKPDPSRPIGQVGKRPSSPTKLFVFAAMYLVCGVLSFFTLKGSVGVIVGLVLIGLSLLWLRGAVAAVARQEERRQD